MGRFCTVSLNPKIIEKSAKSIGLISLGTYWINLFSIIPVTLRNLRTTDVVLPGRVTMPVVFYSLNCSSGLTKHSFYNSYIQTTMEDIIETKTKISNSMNQ